MSPGVHVRRAFEFLHGTQDAQFAHLVEPHFLRHCRENRRLENRRFLHVHIKSKDAARFLAEVTFLRNGGDRVASEIWTFARDARTRAWRLRNAEAT